MYWSPVLNVTCNYQLAEKLSTRELRTTVLFWLRLLWAFTR
jgi:hypothetical protein